MIEQAEKLASRIPDAYFDWYARFIPGCIALFAYFVLNDLEFKVSLANMVLYGFMAYVCGNIVQPLVSFLIVRLEALFKSDPEGRYSSAKKDPKYLVLVGKVSKAHAEASGMLATAILLAIVFFADRMSSVIGGGVSAQGVIIMIFLLMSVERVFARKRKIHDLPNITSQD